MANLGSFLIGGTAALVLLGLSAFFSSSESAIFSLAGSERWAEAVDADHPRLPVLERLLADPHRLLVTLLVGNNVVNIGISSLLAVGLASVLPPGAAIVATTVVGSTVVLVFGEIVPKSYGLGNAREWSLVVARPIALVETALGPVVSLFDWLTRQLAHRLGGDQRIETPYLE